MATQQSRRTMWARTVIGAALAAGAMALATPASSAIADPSSGPYGPNDPAVADYWSTLNDAVKQFTGKSSSSQIDAQQFIDQVAAANNALRDALLANIPANASR